jgi:hypothetical protein
MTSRFTPLGILAASIPDKPAPDQVDFRHLLSPDEVQRIRLNASRLAWGITPASTFPAITGTVH